MIMIKSKILLIALSTALMLAAVPQADAWGYSYRVYENGQMRGEDLWVDPSPDIALLTMQAFTTGMFVGVQSTREPYYGYSPYVHTCLPGYYRASNGDCVERPDQNREGATALCNDGTWSHSEHSYAPGTCSYHGGVRQYVR
jgi:Protein of unknown function (DUF3761)